MPKQEWLLQELNNILPKIQISYKYLININNLKKNPRLYIQYDKFKIMEISL